MASSTTAPATVKAPTSKLGEAFTTAFATRVASMTADESHSTPSLGALVRATRTARGEISQMQLGTNKGKDGSPLIKGLKTPADLGEKDKGHKKSGWFSHVANIEQGGRKTPVDPAFVAYIAALAEVPASQVEALVAEDARLRSASTEANTAS